jgi:transposase
MRKSTNQKFQHCAEVAFLPPHQHLTLALTGIVINALGHSVTDGSLFLFVNRKHDRIKALWWETGGLTLWYRRLEQGTVELPKPQQGQSQVKIDSVELAMWIAGVPLRSAKMRRKRMRVA